MNSTTLFNEDQTDWTRLAALPDAAIDYSDLPPRAARERRGKVHVVRGGGVGAVVAAMRQAQEEVPTPDLLDPDVAAQFPTRESVNEALRLLLRLRAELTQSLPA